MRRYLNPVWTLLKNAAIDFVKDDAPRSSAVVSFFAVMSILPVIILLIQLGMLVLSQAAARDLLFTQLGQFMGRAQVDFLQNLLVHLDESSGALARPHLPVLALFTLLFGASGVFTELSQSLNQIVRHRPLGGWRANVMRRLRSLLLLVIIGLIALSSVGITAGITTLRDFFPHWLPFPAICLETANALVTLGFMTGLLCLVYRWLPDAAPSWKAVRPGALAAACLFVIGKYALNGYIEHSSMGSVYGTGASFIAFLLWIQASVMFIFYGAEIVRQGHAVPEKNQ